MKDASIFLADVLESRRAAQAAERAGFVPTSGLVLREALEVVLKHHFLLSPVLARSQLATNPARVSVPSNDRAQIEYWYSLYGSDANWWMETGASSGVVALEVDPNLARYVLDDNSSWQRTLRFVVGSRWHFLFEYASGLPRLRGYPGLCLHAGDSILVPPSRTLSGVELVYEDLHASLLSADWLREAVNIG